MECKTKEAQLFHCMEDIVRLYEADAIILLDCVLTDSCDEPEYSAIHVYHRLEKIVQFRVLYYHENLCSVADFLLKNSYCQNDVELLLKKISSEEQRYHNKRE